MTALKLPPYPLKNARHHWAVRMLRHGAPIHVIQAQLGHSSAKLTLDTYGAFIPRAEDRARVEAQVMQAEAKWAAALGRGPYVHTSICTSSGVAVGAPGF